MRSETAQLNITRQNPVEIPSSDDMPAVMAANMILPAPPPTGANIIYGSERADSITVSAAEFRDSYVYAMGGDDYVWTSHGNDRIYGGDGNDRLQGWYGDDYIYGGRGNDFLAGEDGNDFLSGDRGNDELVGGLGDDTLIGGRGNDNLYGGFGNDRLNGYGYNINNESQFDNLWGDAGADTFVLGSSHGAYYNETGDGYAVIKDFNYLEGDKFEVHGSINRYQLEAKSINGIGGSALDTEIYYLNNDGSRDRIAIVQDRSGEQVLLSLDFNFV